MNRPYCWRSMAISAQHIVDFKNLYRTHYGVELTDAQALDKGLRLIRLVEVVSRAAARDEEQDSLRNTDNK